MEKLFFCCGSVVLFACFHIKLFKLYNTSFLQAANPFIGIANKLINPFESYQENVQFFHQKKTLVV